MAQENGVAAGGRPVTAFAFLFVAVVAAVVGAAGALLWVVPRG